MRLRWTTKMRYLTQVEDLLDLSSLSSPYSARRAGHGEVRRQHVHHRVDAEWSPRAPHDPHREHTQASRCATSCMSRLVT